jgi:NUMOD4 motif/HNH endonuclease
VIKMEEWRDIRGFEGRYQVSDQGRVKSLTVTVPFRCGFRTHKGAIKKLTNDKDGYLMTQLWKDNKAHPKKVHRLVGAAFLVKPDDATDVNHKDGNKAHNAATNLEWCTHKGNGEHAAATDLTAFGSRHGIAKLTEKDIPVIRKLLSASVSMAKIGRQFGVSSATIYGIAKGNTCVRA